MGDTVVVSIDNISKDFLLPHSRANTLKSSLLKIFDKSRMGTETQHALKNVSLEIKKGEFFGIAGRNGSGKSTLLKMLAGIYQPSRGRITINGKLVPFIELGVGFNPELTGRENVYLNGAILGFSESQVDAMYDDIVEFSELERFMDQKLKNYSSGMQVRLAFSVAIRANADILLIDEVLAVGDAAFQRKCFSYFAQLKKENKTVIFVSHDMDAIRKFCDRAVLIESGTISVAGSAQDIAREYARLFVVSEKPVVTPKNTSHRRFGDRKYFIYDARLNRNNFVRPKDNQLILRATVKSNNRAGDDNQINTGFLIRNAAGEPVFGTNTHIEGAAINGMQSGEKAQVTWLIPNILGDGAYVIDIAVTSLDGTLTHDWWEGCCALKVYNEASSPYIVSPSVGTTVSYL